MSKGALGMPPAAGKKSNAEPFWGCLLVVVMTQEKLSLVRSRLWINDDDELLEGRLL
jgi:hypothetical protein